MKYFDAQYPKTKLKREKVNNVNIGDKAKRSNKTPNK